MKKLKPKERILAPDHDISSVILKRNCQLYISFPLSYSTQDTITYPVLYVLDGDTHFNFFYIENKYLGEEIEEVIIVGIGSGLDRRARAINRGYNFTPSNNLDSQEVKERAKRHNLPVESVISGGAAEFLKALQTEIIPFVDNNYKTNTDRGITGHSLGGLFTAYCLLNSDGYFTRFGINSSSLWWNEEEVVDQAVLKFTQNKTWHLPLTKVFMSVGGREEKDMVPPMVKFCSFLQDANYENIKLSWHVFDNETHRSVVPISLRQTIKELYKK